MATASPAASEWRPAVELIERERVARLLTRKQLADLASIDEKTLNDLVRGVKQPQLRTLAQLAAALEIPPGSLVTFSGLGEQAAETSPPGTSNLSPETGARRVVRERAVQGLTARGSDSDSLLRIVTTLGHAEPANREFESDRGAATPRSPTGMPRPPKAAREASGASTPSAP